MSEKNNIITELEKNLHIAQKQKTEVLPGEIVNDTEKDVEYSREKMKELIDQSCDAISNMMALASESEHPRAFEVLSNMIKHTSDMTQDLVKLQKTRKEITQEKNSGPNSTTTNNAIFVGSTAELQKVLKKEIKNVTDSQ